MSLRRSRGSVKLGFEETSLRVPISSIMPLRDLGTAVKNSVKYAQIAASIAEVGIIEPPAVARDAANPKLFHLLDGHLRVEILRDRGEQEVVCLIAVDDEAFTYNKRISRMATIQEHRMILNAVKKGVSEERLARALNVNIANIRTKRNLLVGICPEVAELLRDKHVPLNVFTELRFLKPLRQIEAAQIMVTMNRFTLAYAKSLVAASSADELDEGRRRRQRGLSDEQIATMQKESENLDRELKLVEKRFGSDQLDLVVAAGYVARLLDNARLLRHMARSHADVLAELQRVVELQRAA